MSTSNESAPSAVARACLVQPTSGEAAASASTGAHGRDAVRVWGLTAEERLRRGLERVGVADVQRIGPAAPDSPAPSVGGADSVIAIRTDHFFDERLLQALVEAEDGIVLCDAGSRADPLAARVASADLPRALAVLQGGRSDSDEAGAAIAGLRRVDPLDLVPAYDPRLRKHSPPFILPARGDAVRAIEDQIFASAYKGITDFITKWVWPVPARAVTRQCVRLGISPNAVTLMSYLLVFAVTWLFAQGAFATGLGLAWLMTFLDTVDGKLARVTLTSSRLGHVLDHGLDLVHPPIWWAAYAFGLAGGGTGFGGWTLAMLVVVVGYVVGRLLEGVFLLAFDQEMFTWRPFDAAFRQVIARRNPNLLMLTLGLLAGEPGAGFVAVAGWTLGSIAIQLVRIAQAFAQQRSGRPIRSWYEEAEAGGRPGA